MIYFELRINQLGRYMISLPERFHIISQQTFKFYVLKIYITEYYLSFSCWEIFPHDCSKTNYECYLNKTARPTWHRVAYDYTQQSGRGVQHGIPGTADATHTVYTRCFRLNHTRIQTRRAQENAVSPLLFLRAVFCVCRNDESAAGSQLMQ